jgi:hypothetical protein
MKVGTSGITSTATGANNPSIKGIINLSVFIHSHSTQMAVNGRIAVVMINAHV